MQRKENGSSCLTNVMASEIGEVELEDGEINDLEDGEIDEDILHVAESNNSIFLPLEYRRQRDSFVRDQHLNDNSYGEKNRDFGFQDSSPPPNRWDTRGVSSSRGKFPRARASATVRGSRTGGRVFRGTGRHMSTGRGKTFPAKRGSQRSRILWYFIFQFCTESRLILWVFDRIIARLNLTLTYRNVIVLSTGFKQEYT